jgi:hypothetical protein
MKANWEEWLRNPPSGSKAAAAIASGVDMEEIIVNLKLTPTQRLEKLQIKMIGQWEMHEKIINMNDTTRSLLCHK